MFRNLPTLKSLPQAIGLPFLSTQEDAQLKFKSELNGIKRLYGDTVSVTPHHCHTPDDTTGLLLPETRGRSALMVLMLLQVIPPSDLEYWSQYYSLFGSSADVYSLISVQDGQSELASTARYAETMLTHIRQ